MITIANTLLKDAIKLELEAESPASALYEVAELLRNDDRVTDWEAFLDELGKTAHCVVEEPSSALCLPHARTDAVRTMVMCAGRAPSGILYPESKKPVRYLFAIGVPKAMASDYLRIVGALMRILRQETVERELRACATAADFQAILANGEMKL